MSINIFPTLLCPISALNEPPTLPYAYSPQRNAVFAYLVQHLTVVEHKWIVRIILGQLNIGLSSASILYCWHSKAQDAMSRGKTLKDIASELYDRSTLIIDDVRPSPAISLSLVIWAHCMELLSPDIGQT